MRITLRSCFAACYILIVFAIDAQNLAKVDSVRKLIETRNLSTNERLEAYYYLSVYSSSPEEELRFGNLLLDLAKKVNNQEYVIKANLRIGVAYRLLGNLGRSLEYLFVSANGAVDIERFTPLLVDIYQEISTCYTQNGDSENALLYGSKTIDILRTTNNKQRLALTLLNVGYDYYLIGKYDSAMACYGESEPILKEIGMTIGLAYIKGNRALVYWKRGNHEQAENDLKLAVEMLEPLGDQYGMADYCIRLGNVVFEEGKVDEAVTHATKGLIMASEEGLKEQVRDASHLLFLIFQSAGEYKKAIKYQTQFYAYKDSIQNLETTHRLANLRTAFEVGQKQAEVDLLIEQKRSNQIIMITGGIAFFIVMCLFLIIYRFSKTRIELNKQLGEQKEALIELNSTKDKFFSIISHDLRGPVNNISGLVSLTRYYLDDENIEDLRDMLNKMERSTERLVKLLDNLLHWALLQRGHFPYDPESLGIKDILVEVTDMFDDMATSKDIRLDLQLEEDFDLFVDKNTTSTMFRNLLSNAIKFTETGGQIQVSAMKNGKAGIIKFVDNGVGMPDAKLKVLFELNDKITTKGTSGETGLGLGLQLVYDFVQLNKGKIEVESQEGKGTSFSVHLPLSASIEDSKSPG